MTPGPQPTPGGVARDAGTVAAVTALSRVVGFARWLVFAWAVGATGVGTVYQSVNTVPNIVYEIAAGGILAAVVVPLVAGRLGSTEGERADEIASALLTRTVAVLVPLAVLVALAAPFASRALLGDLEVDGAVALGTRLLLVFSPQVLLYGIGIVVSGVLQAHRRFLAAALAPLLSSLVAIATYVLWALAVPPGTRPDEVTTRELLLLGGGTTLGVAALSLPLLVVAERAGIRLRPRWRLATGTAARARTLAGAGVVALVAQQLSVLVTLAVANRSGGDGSLVVQNYVQALYLLPYAVLAVPVATAVFPVLAATAGEAADQRAGAVGTLAASLAPWWSSPPRRSPVSSPRPRRSARSSRRSIVTARGRMRWPPCLTPSPRWRPACSASASRRWPCGRSTPVVGRSSPVRRWLSAGSSPLRSRCSSSARGPGPTGRSSSSVWR